MFPVNNPDDRVNLDIEPKALVENFPHESFETMIKSINDIEILKEFIEYADIDINMMRGNTGILFKMGADAAGLSEEEYRNQKIAGIEANKDLIKARIKELETT